MHTMRVTVAISDDLLIAAERLAQQRGTSLSDVITAALRRELGISEQRTVIPVFQGGAGPQPGIDLTSNRALHEVLDEGTGFDSLR